MHLEDIPANIHLSTIIRDPNRILFEGAAVAVSSYNSSGIFDVLPMHANFISLISKKITIVKPDQTLVELSVTSAVLKVENNTVQVYIGAESVNLERKQRKGKQGGEKENPAIHKR